MIGSGTSSPDGSEARDHRRPAGHSELEVAGPAERRATANSVRIVVVGHFSGRALTAPNHEIPELSGRPPNECQRPG